jgi:hypothetical protein
LQHKGLATGVWRLLDSEANRESEGTWDDSTKPSRPAGARLSINNSAPTSNRFIEKVGA